MANLHPGQSVKWNWGQGEGHGTVKQRFERKVQRTIKGSRIVRNGSRSDPAFLIEQQDGDVVLKLASELEKD